MALLLYIFQNWCEAHLKPGFIGRTKTTNGIESLNKSFKHFHLKLQGNGTISTMIEVLVTDFVPGMMEEYRNLNFMSSTQYKRYNSIIPVYLHNRPREVVTLLLKHIGSAEYSHPADVNELPDGTFEVNSEADDQRWYKVHLGNDREDLWPSCSCPSFTSLRMLCKHFFVIFKHTDKTWDDLSSNFKNSPYLTLDNEFLSDGILSFDFKVEEVETDELDQLIKLMRQQEIEEKRQERKKEELNNHEKMLSKQQASLREKLRLITDLSFDVTELKVIQSVCRSLDSCIDTMENSVKKENDIRVSQDQPVKIERSTAPQIVRNLPLRKGRLKLKKKQKSNKGE